MGVAGGVYVVESTRLSYNRQSSLTWTPKFFGASKARLSSRMLDCDIDV
jgi:hypothetical protein